MDYWPPRDLQNGPPRIGEGTNAETERPGPFEPLFQNVLAAPENAAATGYIDPNFHDYSDSNWATEPAPFPGVSAFGSAHSAHFPMHPDPTSNNTWNPSPPPNQFHGPEFSTWTAPNEWKVSNGPSRSGAGSFVAAQATTGQWPPVLQSSLGFGPANPIATYPGQEFKSSSNTSQDMPQHLHFQATNRSAPGPRALEVIRRPFQYLRDSITRDVDSSCWRCKSDHKKCGDGNPCPRCQTAPSPANSAIPCRRGQVCDAAAEIPFLCYMPQGDSTLEVVLLPPDLELADNFLGRQREKREVARKHGVGCNCTIFCRVVNTKVENIRHFDHFAGLELTRNLDVPYDYLIGRILWELEDSPEVAHLAGVESLTDLVMLLEAACLLEVQWGHYELKRRLVYSSMRCLLHCAEALRLSVHGMLAADPHAHCAQGGKCISPAFNVLTKYALRYTEALTIELFHKNRGKHGVWLQAFYSLCLQQHVRRGLMSLEERLQSLRPSTGSMDVDDPVMPLRSASYLQTAVSLFGKISIQGRGKLAKLIRNSQPKDSVYFPPPPHPSSFGGGRISSIGWQSWRKEGVGVHNFLEKVFQIPTNFTIMQYTPHGNEPPTTSTSDSDSDATIILQASTTATTAVPSATVTVAAAATTAPIGVGPGVSNITGGCWAVPPSGNTPAPSIIGSTWSETSYEETSDASTIDADSIAPSDTSYGLEFVNPSLLSLSTITSRRRHN